MFVLNSPLQVQVEDRIKSHFQLNFGSFKLVSCGDNSKISPHYHLPSPIIQKCNGFVPQDMSTQNVKSILDLTDLPIQSLHWMKNDPHLELTMVLNNDDICNKTKLDVVTELASQNGICLDQISGISSLALIQHDEPFDLIVLDPILPSGRLNSQTLLEISQNQKSSNFTTCPHQVTLWCALIGNVQLFVN